MLYEMTLEFMVPNIQVLAYSHELQTAMNSFNEKSREARNKKSINKMQLNRSSINLTLESRVPLEVPGRSLQTFVRSFLDTLSYEQREYFVRDGRVFRTISTEVLEEEEPIFVGDKLVLAKKVLNNLTDPDTGDAFARELQDFLLTRQNAPS